MKRVYLHIAGWFLALLLIACSTTQTDQIATDDLDQIHAAGKIWIQCYEALDPDCLADLYADDAILMWKETPHQNGLKSIKSYLKAFFKTIETAHSVHIWFEYEDERIKNDQAILVFKWWLEIDFSPNTDPYRDAGRSLMVMRKIGMGEWKIWREMDNHSPDIQTEPWPYTP